MKRRLSDFADTRVVGEDGRPMGRLLDFLLHNRGKQRQGAMTIDAIVCGELGLLERAGFRVPEERIVRWDDVISIEPGRIVVRSRKG